MKAVKITVDPFHFTRLITCSIHKAPNAHFTAQVSGYVEEEKADEAVLRFSPNENITIRITDENEEQATIFTGIVQEISICTENGLKRLELTAASHTVLLDEKEQIRVFQNAKQSYRDILKTFCDTYEHAAFISTAGDAAIGGMVVQYKETDWAFLKRMASRVHTVLVPGSVSSSLQLCFGVPQKSTVFECHPVTYQVRKNIAAYLRGRESIKGYMEQDTAYYVVSSREIFEIGTPVLLNGLKLYVMEADSQLVGSELMHTYTLSYDRNFKMVSCCNRAIAGISMEGTIADVQTDIVKVALAQDENGPVKWFSYATVYSSPEGTGWYCMPEKGDAVRIYFPDAEEDHAFAVQGVHLNAQNGERENPDTKSIRSIHNKEVRFTPTSILITNHKGMSVLLDDKKGIQIQSGQDVLIEAGQNIVVESKAKVEIRGDQGVTARQKDNAIDIIDGISQSAAAVVQK